VAGFQSVEEFTAVVGDFLDVVRQDPRSVLAGSGFVLVFRLTDLDVEVVLDATVTPKAGSMFDVRIGKDVERAKATVTYEMTSDTLDRVCAGGLAPIIALASGDVRIKGGDHVGVMRLMRAAIADGVPLYRRCRGV